MSCTDPVAPKVPIPAMLTVVALFAVQLRVEDSPAVILLGCALKSSVGLSTAVITWTTVELEDVPPGPVAAAV